jgi:hypothetical protein
VVSEVQRLFNQAVEADAAAIAAAAARMPQHARDDAVGAPAVLGDLGEVRWETEAGMPHLRFCAQGAQ